MSEEGNASQQGEKRPFGKPLWVTIIGFIVANFVIISALFAFLKDRAEQKAVEYVEKESTRVKASLDMLNNLYENKLNKLDTDFTNFIGSLSEKRFKTEALEERLDSIGKKNHG